MMADDIFAGLMRVRGSYLQHCIFHGIGQPYVNQAMLDAPPPLGSGKLTIPQALAVIGNASSGDAWRDWERTARYFPEPVLSPSETLSKLLKDAEGRGKPIPAPPLSIAGGGRRMLQSERPSYEERMQTWKAGAEGRRKEAEDRWADIAARFSEWREGAAAHAPAVLALSRAFDTLVNFICDEAVHPEGCWLGSGRIGPLDPSYFRNSAQKVALIRWSHITHDGKACAVAFVDEADLRTALGAGATPTVEGINVAELSAYLKLALHVHQLGFGPSFKGEKKEVQRALVAASPQFGLSLSQNVEENLATFLRNPDAQAGKARKRDG